MPGVTVTITSPQQMGTRAAVTDVDGTYRFTAVTPGDYVVLFELAGFSTVRNEGIRVSLGFTATVNAELKVASLQESVTVTGQSPVVDTSATAIGNIFDAKQLSALPTSRDYFSLLAQSPAVQMARIDVGGSTNGTQQGFVVYGTTGQVRVIFEGINATENTGAFGNYPDVGGMEEVQMNTAAHTAEASTPGRADAVHQQVGRQPVPRHVLRRLLAGELAGLQHRRRSDRARPDRRRRPATRRTSIASSSYQDDERRGRRLHDEGSAVVVRLVAASGHQGALRQFPGEAAADRPQQLQRQGHLQPDRPTTSSSSTRNRRRKSSRSASTHGCSASTPVSIPPKRRRGTRTSGRGCTRAEWNGVISDNAFAEIRGGQYGYDWTNGVNGTGLRYEDISNNNIHGRNRNWARERRRDQVLGTFSLFKNWGGDHNFKIGGEVFHETMTDIFIDGFEEDFMHVTQNCPYPLGSGRELHEARRHPVPAR